LPQTAIDTVGISVYEKPNDTNLSTTILVTAYDKLAAVYCAIPFVCLGTKAHKKADPFWLMRALFAAASKAEGGVIHALVDAFEYVAANIKNVFWNTAGQLYYVEVNW
jgi:hypothetical protein